MALTKKQTMPKMKSSDKPNVRKRQASLEKKMKRPANVRKRPAALKNKTANVLAVALKNKIVWKTWPVEFEGVEGGLLYKWKLLGLWINFKKRTVNEKWDKSLI